MDVKNVADAIQRARRAKGWSQERLGQEAKVPQSHIARIEGGADVRISTVRRVLVALGYEIRFHPSLSDRFTHPVPGGRIAAARDFGVDLNALYAGLMRSPEERLDLAVQNANSLAELFT